MVSRERQFKTAIDPWYPEPPRGSNDRPQGHIAEIGQARAGATITNSAPEI
jgi:hypothetical protein